jgi:hypothetical protein
MFTTILRAAIICVASLIPENSPLDSVVFRSSIQIVLSVFYFLLFTLVSIVMRVMVSRRALVDPTDTEDRETTECDEVLFDDDVDYNSAVMRYAPDSQVRPVGPTERHSREPLQANVRRNGTSVLSRMGRKVRHMASVVVVGPENLEQSGVSTHVRAYAPSVDDPDSDMSDAVSVDDMHDHAAGVQSMRVHRGVDRAMLGLKQSDVVETERPGKRGGGRRSQKYHAAASQVSQGGAFVSPSTPTDLPIDHKMTLSSVKMTVHPSPVQPLSQRSSRDDVHRAVGGLSVPTQDVEGGQAASMPDGLPDGRPSDGYHDKPVCVADDGLSDTWTLAHERHDYGLDDIYTDVYGLGFAGYVLHYTIDCASIQPTGFLLIGLTLLSGRDVGLIADSVRLDDDSIPQTTLFTRALTVFAFILLTSAQVCMIVGIARVPTYYTDARDGGITMIPAPQSILEHLLARVFPLCTPLLLFLVSRKRARRYRPQASISTVFRRAMPITVCIALWFITCFGVMSDRIRNAVGALSVNATVAELSATDVTIDMHLSMVFLSPFLKTPALISVIACCLSRKTMDVASTLAVVFYAKQLHAVRDIEMLQMLSVAFMCSCIAWVCCIIRHCHPLVRVVASFFERHNGTYTIDD